MNVITLSYLDHEMRVCPPSEGLVPEGWHGMDDSDWEACFAALVEHLQVWVELRRGLRPLSAFVHCRFCTVKAAGGLAEAPDGRWLMICREGRWDLPKGMVERGETLRQAALREVGEETSVADLVAGPLLLKTYHIFDKYGGWHFKQTSWFAMSCPSAMPTAPQADEGISQAVWVEADTCVQRLRQSYASLRLLAGRLRPAEPINTEYSNTASY